MTDPRRQHHTWSDEQLMNAVASLDDLAFQALYQRHASVALGLATRIVSPPLRAEDVVQDAFLTIWRNSSRYDPGRGPVRPWLLGVVRNRAIDAIRHARTHRESFEDPEEVLRNVTAGALPEGQVLRNEDARVVRNAIDQLPPDQVIVIELAYFKGLTHIEIAEITGAPLGTVKGRMRLALLRLRGVLDDFSGAER